MPVATLRVWERRYGVTQPTLSASGQRLYSAQDVRRLAVLKQLTDLGHAIGSLAPLDMDQLQQVAGTHAAISVARHSENPAVKLPLPVQPWRVAVIGTALFARLDRPALMQQLSRPVRLVGPFADVPHAAAALQDEAIDAMVVHEPRLHEGWLAAVKNASPALAAVPKAVLYRFAAESTCAALATSGIALLREPQIDIVVGQWLHGVLNTKLAPRTTPHELTHTDPATLPRRWDDAALSDFSAQSSSIACECPRHVAEVLMQLAHFEAYSAECRSRNARDAQMHTYLQQVASSSRIRFEQALEYVALHEGMRLPRHEQPERTPP
ncbi:MAG: MerR family transcriptional regulator [Pseudomonadota bacterium]